MTRTLDESIVQYQEKAEYFKTTTNVAYALELKQIAEWLEELKAYREIGTVEECKNSVLDIERAYKKAIDDFVNACKENTMCKTFGLREIDIEKIAEQLKVGGENEEVEEEYNVG